MSLNLNLFLLVRQPRSRMRILPRLLGRSFSSSVLSSVPSYTLFDRALASPSSLAIQSNSNLYTYQHLIHHALNIQSRIAAVAPALTPSVDLTSSRSASSSLTPRVLFLAPPSFEFAAIQWSIWLSGAASVPLHSTIPPSEIDYFLSDSRPSLVISHSKFSSLMQPIAQKAGIPFMQIDNITPDPVPPLPPISRYPASLDKLALVLYTSGSTGKPKGVAISHSMLQYQQETLVKLWQWQSQDRILNVLPLHHVHGLINVLGCALHAGALNSFHEKFDAAQVINEFTANLAFLKHDNSSFPQVSAHSTESLRPFSVFMAVPTIYAKLIGQLEKSSAQQRADFRKSCSAFRLMVSGSAACPVPILERWRSVSGLELLERYGMTELGMALSMAIGGPKKFGFVGKPLPGLQVKVAHTDADADRQAHQKVHGELLVKGPIFSGYLNRPEATREAFDSDGYFRTGDVVEVDQDGDFKILGRASVDILKSGGYKLSALDVERELLEHPAVEECAVVGIPDEEYGQIVGAVIVLRKAAGCLSLDDLQQWARMRLERAAIPRRVKIVSVMPRNAMGKVNKKELVKVFLTTTENK